MLCSYFTMTVLNTVLNANFRIYTARSTFMFTANVETHRMRMYLEVGFAVLNDFNLLYPILLHLYIRISENVSRDATFWVFADMTTAHLIHEAGEEPGCFGILECLEIWRPEPVWSASHKLMYSRINKFRTSTTSEKDRCSREVRPFKDSKTGF